MHLPWPIQAREKEEERKVVEPPFSSTTSPRHLSTPPSLFIYSLSLSLPRQIRPQGPVLASLPPPHTFYRDDLTVGLLSTTSSQAAGAVSRSRGRPSRAPVSPLDTELRRRRPRPAG